MSFGVHRRPVGLWAYRLAAASLGLLILVACEPSAPPGFTGSVAPGGPSVAPGTSVAAPDASGLVEGKPTVTTDGGTVLVAGLGAGKSDAFDLPAGSVTIDIIPCAGGLVSPFVTIYDGKDNKVGLTVDPTSTLKNLVGGAYYLDVSANPTCVWGVRITPG